MHGRFLCLLSYCFYGLSEEIKNREKKKNPSTLVFFILFKNLTCSYAELNPSLNSSCWFGD